MFSKNCGDELPEKSTTCSSCHKATGENKVALGIVYCLFFGTFGLLGLLMGICMYSNGTKERKTFLIGWSITFFIKLAVFIFLFIFIYKYALLFFYHLYRLFVNSFY